MQSLIRVPPAAAVAVTIHTTRPLALVTFWGILGHKVTALDLLLLGIFLQQDPYKASQANGIFFQ